MAVDFFIADNRDEIEGISVTLWHPFEEEIHDDLREEFKHNNLELIHIDLYGVTLLNKEFIMRLIDDTEFIIQHSTNEMHLLFAKSFKEYSHLALKLGKGIIALGD